MIKNHTKITVLVGLASILLTGIVVLIAAAFTEQGEFPLTQAGACFLGIIAVGLMIHEAYSGYRWRDFNRMYIELRAAEQGSRLLTETQRDSLINELVVMSDNTWIDFLNHCMDVNEFWFRDASPGIIMDIEMLRALKD